MTSSTLNSSSKQEKITDETTMDRGGEQRCCLKETDNGKRCMRSAGTASYSKRIERIVLQRRLKFTVDDSAGHAYICDHHKDLIQSARPKRRRNDSGQEGAEDECEIDFNMIPVNTLRRYKRHFKLSTRPGVSKTQLVEIVRDHFKTLPVNSKEVLTFFVYMIKSHRSTLDQRPRNDDPPSPP